MATYVLIPGAGGDPFFWHRVTPLLEEGGHVVVAVDLPGPDETAGIPEYADIVVDAIGRRRDLILVAQSMGGLVAPLVCERVPVDLLVMLAAMVPRPGETGGEWWDNVGQGEAARTMAEREGRPTDGEFDVMAGFFHDVPPDVTAAMMSRGARPEADVGFTFRHPLERWPDVPTRFLLCRQDRLFPAEMMRRQATDRLGVVADEMDGGHLAALSRPGELVARLEACRSELASAPGR